jgi:hypothetical protein
MISKLHQRHIVQPFDLQQHVIPHALQGSDCMLRSQPGCCWPNRLGAWVLIDALVRSIGTSNDRIRQDVVLRTTNRHAPDP